MKTSRDNPYVGLRPFQTDESLLFFGRNDQITELLHQLNQHRFVAVVGGSGCGKSSLLKAGVIPSLKAGYLVHDSDHWEVFIMKPGHSPLYNLASSIIEQLGHDKAEVPQLLKKIEEEGVDALTELFLSKKNEKHTNFFLLVDQFEELMRFSSQRKNKDEASEFVNIMLNLSNQNDIPVYVVMTMRSDFIGDCAQYRGLTEALNQSIYLVPKLTRQQNLHAIEGPAKLFGRTIQSALKSKLLNSLHKVGDELPLMQHCLMRMWNVNPKSKELTLDDYDKVGGIEGALSQHADEALKEIDKGDYPLVETLFQSLTVVDDHGRKIRRPTTLTELEGLMEVPKSKVLALANNFMKDNRSFIFLNDIADSEDKLVDISHESLIRQWKKMQKWVEKEFAASENYVSLREAHQKFLKKDKDRLTGTELSVYKKWQEEFKPKKQWAEKYGEGFDQVVGYLNDSIRAERKSKRGFKLVFIGFTVLVSALAFYLSYLNEKTTTALNDVDDLIQLIVHRTPDLQNFVDPSVEVIKQKLWDELIHPIQEVAKPKVFGEKGSGNGLYDLTFQVEVPPFRKTEIQEVRYQWPCILFTEQDEADGEKTNGIYISREPKSSYSFNYENIGCCKSIQVEVILINGKGIKLPDIDLTDKLTKRDLKNPYPLREEEIRLELNPE